MRSAVSVVFAVAVVSTASAFAAPVRSDGPTPVSLTGSSSFDLFTPAANVLLRVNRVQCNITVDAQVCRDAGSSFVLGGGFWPRGTEDRYVYNGGLQISAIIAGTSQQGFPWVGDTVGAFFFDARGAQGMAEPLAGVYDWLNASDRLRWPSAARIGDPSLFDPSLIGLGAASDQDTWLRFWDGGTQTLGRPHPAGLLVDQRTLAWDRPGLDDIVFFIYRIINISSRFPASYQRLAAAGYDQGDIDAIASLGRRFYDTMKDRFQVQLPDTGYTLRDLYLGVAQDPDVGYAGSNYSNGNFVFDGLFAYKSNFLEPSWQYPPAVFSAPFASAPGFEGEALLRVPADTSGTPPGITMLSNTTGGAPFPDPLGVARLWRNMSLNLLPTDGVCAVANPKQRRLCYFAQVRAETRIYTASGPSRLDPGQSAVFVVAQVYAPPVQAAVAPYIGGDLRPGFAVEGARLAQGLDTVRTVDRVAGWVSSADVNGDGRIDPDEVVTIRGSLYWKFQLARATLNHGFLVAQAPAPPTVSVLPGDNQATVVWQPSTSEATGDPYFAAAADPTSPAYDPDFRRYDVEGYRVWRGRSPSTMRAIAQFDYAGNWLDDYTGQFQTSSACAPELGVTSSCPVLPNRVPVVGNVIQYRIGDRILQGNGSVAVLHADTAVTGGGSGRQPLRDTGVPFTFVDHGVRNGETWLYAVTAFDVNSVRSGPSTLESPLALHAVTPRVPAGNVRPAVIALDMLGDDGVALDPTRPFPAIDAAHGTFQGPIPPANAGVLTLLDQVPELLAAGDYEVRIDSVSSGFIHGISTNNARRPRLFLTFTSPDTTLERVIDLDPPTFNSSAPNGDPVATEERLLRYDTAAATRFGVPPAAVAAGRLRVGFVDTITSIASQSATVAMSQGRYGQADQASRYLAHSRWYDEGNKEPADPTIDFAPSASHNSGALTGVSLIWAPTVYRNPTASGGPTQINPLFRGYVYGRPIWYPADFTVTWGPNGTVTVRDSTHHVNLPAKQAIEPGYGFLNASVLVAAGVTSAMIADGTGTPDVTVPSYHALYAVDPVCEPDWWTIPCAGLSSSAELQPLDFNNDGVSDGTGIIMLVNGEAFFMWMNALPAVGTQWHLRAVGGQGMQATCTPSLPANRLTDLLAAPSGCVDYAFSPLRATRPALAPGLTFRLRVARTYTVASADSADLSRVHTVPDPYYLGTSLETDGYQRLTFVNLPDRAVIRIYSLSGILVQILNHHDASGGGEAVWDLRSRTGRRVASGVYLYHIEAADGRTRVGRMTIVNGQ